MARVLCILACVLGLVGLALAAYGIYLGGPRAAGAPEAAGSVFQTVVLLTTVALPLGVSGLLMGVIALVRCRVHQEDGFWLTPALALNAMMFIALLALWIGK
jgi:hypothetical protein